jgi:NADPH:quinone reductase-like Zn-dependent oxidoreductase
MRAIVYERSGFPEVLEARELPAPTPGEGEVLVRVRAAAVGAGDWHLLRGEMWAVRLYQGMRAPKRPVLGHECAGLVEAVGAGVEGFAAGDEVFGESGNAGTFAEWVCIPERTLAPKPAGLSFEEAAALPVSATTALQGLRDKGKIQAGQKVLINGASGGVGCYAVQIAKSFGAEVTGTCSAGKMDLVRSLGADHVLDYREADFTDRAERYDLVLDCVGTSPLKACKRRLTPAGIYVAVAGAPLRGLRIALAGGKQAVAYIAKPNRADLDVIGDLVARGELRPVVDRCFALGEVPDALRYFGEHRARGKIVIALPEGR